MQTLPVCFGQVESIIERRTVVLDTGEEMNGDLIKTTNDRWHDNEIARQQVKTVSKF
jgi:hypothetical protein